VIEVVLQPTPQTVAEAIRRIVQTVQPVRIVVFGSRARGEHAPESDLDLLIILPGATKCEGLAADLYKAIGALGFSKDILLSNEERLERLKGSVNSVEAEAAREGLIVYEDGCTDRAALAQVCR
jgi:predicted nucleotidyltransferase